MVKSMLKNRNGIIKNETGAFFAFGPWWFVILIMIIGVIFSILNNNKDKSAESVYDYKQVDKPNIPFNTENICPQCGKNNSKTAKFCNGCGSNLADYPGTYCPECGAINLVNTNFCQQCGKSLKHDEVE